MPADLGSERLAAYGAPEFVIQCRTCQRAATVDRTRMQKRFGDVTLLECARFVAAQRGCDRGADCSVGVFESPFDHWAKLRDAAEGRWVGLVYCGRRHAGMKSARSCAHPVPLHVPSLIAALGGSYSLYQLRLKVQCPQCESSFARIEWRRPDNGGR